MASNKVTARIKLRTTPPSNNQLQKGEVYIRAQTVDEVDQLSIYIGTDDLANNNVIDTNIKPIIIKKMNDNTWQPTKIAGFTVSDDKLSAPAGSNSTIENPKITGSSIEAPSITNPTITEGGSIAGTINNENGTINGGALTGQEITSIKKMVLDSDSVIYGTGNPPQTADNGQLYFQIS